MDDENLNPWLTIPAADYEGHMNDPSVDQSSFIGDCLKRACAQNMPADLAILGVATGNGLEYIDKSVTRIVGIDINREFLDLTTQRYCKRHPGLELVCADLFDCDYSGGKFDLIFAGLVMEYVDYRKALSHIGNWIAAEGRLVVILQLEGRHPGVSKTKYESIQRLAPLMKLIEPDDFLTEAAGCGFIREASNIHTLKSGKQFWEGTFIINNQM